MNITELTALGLKLVKLNLPHQQSYISTLGGVEHASLMFTLSMERKDQWLNGILQNSKYGNFYLGSDGKLELHSGYGKLRKCKVANWDDLQRAINKWVLSLEGNHD